MSEAGRVPGPREVGRLGKDMAGVTTPVAGTGHAVYGFIVDGVWAQRNGLAYSVQFPDVVQTGLVVGVQSFPTFVVHRK